MCVCAELISRVVGFSKGSKVEVVTDFLDVLAFLSDTSMNDTDTLTNLINLAFNLRFLLIDDWRQLGHDPKQSKRMWSQHQGSSDLFPLTTYDRNSHIPSHGKTCKPAARNNI